jgi:hypothetical protein
MTTRSPYDRVVGRDRPQLALRLPLLERWHLLSFDAPTLATLWTWFLARCAGAHATPATLAAMFLAVWVLYAADRLLDARVMLQGNDAALEARHYFHATHRRSFLAAIALAAPALVFALAAMPRPLLLAYFVLAALLALWLGIVHTSPNPARLPKELAVGLFFAIAVALPATFAKNAQWFTAMLPCAVMASLNCLFLLAWETRPHPHRATHPSSAFAVRHLRPLTLAAMLACLALAAVNVSPHQAPANVLPPLACALSLTLLLLLHRTRDRFTPTTLRALADAALLTPIAAAPLLRILSR